MRKAIIVTTDFSDSAANALNYACEFAKDYDLQILLTHIYTIPGNYAGEGLSLASINDVLNNNIQMLRDEWESAKGKYPNLTIDERLITGEYLGALQNLQQEVDPAMIIMGAVGEYSDLSLWDDDWLNALITVSCPVLVIPIHITYSPLLNIAFACDHKKIFSPKQVSTINSLITLTEANFYIVHITPKMVSEAEDEAIEKFTQLFSDLDPQYHTIESKQIIGGIAEFVKQYDIDLLVVTPHKHGLWHSLFNTSYTKQLALLNHLPVMAIHEL